MAASILAIVAALVGFIIWWAQRQADPTPQQQSDQRAAMLAQLRDSIVAAENRGDLSTADSLRERLQLLTDPVRYPDGGGQRLAVSAPQGQQNNSANAGSDGTAASHGSE